MSSVTSPTFNPTYLTVANEGASLKVWYQGNGPLLILIQGGGGDGGRFNSCIPSLSKSYNVATYDRRGNGQSTVNKPGTLNPWESAGDVIAIITALGYSKASLFGTSSGGLIALQVVASYPEYVSACVIHEIPIITILPNDEIWRIHNAYIVMQTYEESGAEAALEKFKAGLLKKLVPVNGGEREKPTEQSSRIVEPSHKLDYFFKYEFLVFHIYTPNLNQCRVSGVPIATVEGKESKGIFHATSAQVQSDILGCRHVVWPGAHAPFMTIPEVFAEKLHETILTLCQ